MDDQATRFLKEAAQETLKRIETHRQRAPEPVARALAYLGDNLLDPDLNCQSLVMTCQLNDRIAREFRKLFGVGLSRYIWNARLDVASGLLRNTSLPVSAVSTLVCYADTPSFCRAFKKLFRAPASDYRERVQGARRYSISEQETIDFLHCCERAIQGDLDLSEARRLARTLQGLYPRAIKVREEDQEKPEPIGLIDCDPSRIERFLAEEIWLSIESLSFQHQKAQLQTIRFRSKALFELLHRKSRLEARRNLEHAVEIARLAVDSVESSVDILAEYRSLKVLSKAWLANVYRLNRDFLTAEATFLEAEIAIEAAPTDIDRLTMAQFCTWKAMLRAYQGQMDGASLLSSKSIALLREVDCDPRLLAEALLVRALVADWSGATDPELNDLREAVIILGKSNDEYLSMTATVNLVISLALLGKTEQAEVLLPQAKKLCRSSGAISSYFRLQWVQGLVKVKAGKHAFAEQHYLVARRGLLDLEDSIHYAIVSLELALLYSKMGRRVEVTDIVKEVLPALEKFNYEREGALAIHALRSAIPSQMITSKLLERVRDHHSGMLRLGLLDRRHEKVD